MNDSESAREIVPTLLVIVSLSGALVSLLTALATHRKMAIRISGALLILVALIVVIGYLAGAPTIYTWPPGATAMALPTGICFGIVGVCLICLSDTLRKR